MVFQVGKYYRHATGKKIYICGSFKSKLYGFTLMAEDPLGKFAPVGDTKDHTINWNEINHDDFHHLEFEECM